MIGIDRWTWAVALNLGWILESPREFCIKPKSRPHCRPIKLEFLGMRPSYQCFLKHFMWSQYAAQVGDHCTEVINKVYLSVGWLEGVFRKETKAVKEEVGNNLWANKYIQINKDIKISIQQFLTFEKLAVPLPIKYIRCYGKRKGKALKYSYVWKWL